MIEFKTVRWKNLLSYGNVFTEIGLNSNKTTLIVGKNGHGKSVLLEAITFGLYGKAFRKINKNQLINSINGKNLLVEVEFSVGSKSYLIRRGIKPTVFEIICNDVLINQEASSRDYQDVLETSILKMNHKSFCQIVVLGTATFVPFMQLAAQQRRDFIEDLLDIEVFSLMNSLLKDKITSNKETMSACDTEIKLLQQKIELAKRHIQSFSDNNDALIKNKQDIIEHYQLKNTEQEEKIATLNTNITSLIEQYKVLVGNDIEDLSTKKKKYQKLKTELNVKRTHLDKQIKFLNENDNCPTCSQKIEEAFKRQSIDKFTDKTKELILACDELSSREQKVSDLILSAQKIKSEFEQCQSEISTLNFTIKTNKNFIKQIETEIESLRNTHANLLSKDTSYFDSITDLERLNSEKEALFNKRVVLSSASILLKDGGIKTRIIKQYIPIINKLINKYLIVMDFFVEFQLDENFNELIKSRHRDEFTYNSFSEGEKMRLNLAMMFAWRAVAKLRNNAGTNLLILDEVADGSLDQFGMDQIFALFKTELGESNIFVISHRSDSIVEKFDRTLLIEKYKNFSEVVEK